MEPGCEAVGSANAIPPDNRPGFAGAGIPERGAATTAIASALWQRLDGPGHDGRRARAWFDVETAALVRLAQLPTVRPDVLRMRESSRWIALTIALAELSVVC